MHTTAIRLLYIILGTLAAGLTAQPALAQAGLGPVNNTINRSLERRLPRLEDRVDAELRREAENAERATQDALQSAPADAVPAADSVGETGTSMIEDTTAAAQHAVGSLRPFVADVDPFGNAIEQNTLVVLIAQDQLAELRAQDLSVIAERDMPGLGMVLVTLRAAQGYGLAEKALELRAAFPAAAVDYNHLYSFQGADATGMSDSTAPLNDPALPATTDSTRVTLRIGLIDSAVVSEHASLQGVTVTARDFVTNAAERPVGHGTAVASVIASSASRPVSILAATVFFQVPGHAPGASTESLVTALDWLAAEKVDAINMSLAGPANALLEQSLLRLSATEGPPVIAAVGNNGPSGEPMYPGAYESVVGVTAIDREQKAFRYANRGDHVDFAALGVDVKVANSAGGWRLESGTSMAAPRVAVIVAALSRDSAASGAALRDLLIRQARDLGRPGFDPVFGYGLLTESPELVSRIKMPPQN